MCDFPSWIETEDGKNWFLVDRDVVVGMENKKFEFWVDALGHSAIEKLFGVKGKHKEGREGLPPEFEQAIRDGKCNRMAKVDPSNAYRFVRDLLPFHPLEGEINGHLHLNGNTNLTSLPSNMKVNGNLNLTDCTGLTEIPPDLEVMGWADFSGCTGLTTIPETIKVWGTVYISRTITHIKCKDGSLIPVNPNNVTVALKRCQINVTK